ncbi:MAG: hypothetical protein A2086_11280 [Spirochaetes bacterium GWD1_27_9]|nr:MAG: hypothetical protein A2Z98_16125 [Spirochaetes bacterium GWB1_27_13]OHD24976.1 MAG: hypothetical protein A2Y34_10170 [Spirochaetes bacterium GWC1_27_15]OHD44156.1 MAG: hypothetical protein A2086_11280 [Spirochaetes bacterium GWD1_27_9]
MLKKISELIALLAVISIMMVSLITCPIEEITTTTTTSIIAVLDVLHISETSSTVSNNAMTTTSTTLSSSSMSTSSTSTSSSTSTTTIFNGSTTSTTISNLLWNKKFNSFSVNSIFVDTSGNVYVAGDRTQFFHFFNSKEDWRIKKFNSSGIEDTTNWDKKINYGFSYQNSIFVDNSGNVYVVDIGYNLVSINSGIDWWIKKFNSSGIEDTTNWDKTVDSGGGDIVNSIFVDNSGNVYIVGIRTNLISTNIIDGIHDWWIKKFNSSGIEDTTNWDKKIYSSESNSNSADLIFVDSSGNVYVAGTGYNLVSNNIIYNWWIKKFNSSGIEDTTNWDKKIYYGYTSPNSIFVDSSDNVYLAGSEENYPNNIKNNWRIKKFSSSGIEDTNWDKKINTSSQVNYNNAKSVFVDNSSNVYVGGCEFYSTSSIDLWIKKFNPLGVEDTNWDKKINISSQIMPFPTTSISVDTSGNVYATIYGDSLNSDWLIKKFNSSGVEQ